MNTVTCVAPVNIAVIKYWGKRDETLILPINDSLSASLDTEHLCAKTTVSIGPNFTKDRIWLNGEEQDIKNPRLQNCLREIRKRSNLSGQTNEWRVHICSKNNFPTAAGLASSAAGYACLIVALAKLYNVEGDISSLARTGSGSACRSVMGGFVRWHMGVKPDGSDSIAEQIVPADYWPEMRILILVVNDRKKTVSSAIGMKRSVETSEFLKYRAKYTVPERMNKILEAIRNKDFKTFAELTMRDSNEMHAVALDTYPPCVYMNDISHSIVNLIHLYNSAVNDVKVAYTYDAGPNATLYLLEKDVPEVIGIIDYFFPPLEITEAEYRKGLPFTAIRPSKNVLDKIAMVRHVPGQLKYIIHTRVGSGPRYLEESEKHLLDHQGLPKCLS